jgi:NitT/TauT family transport system substrate-binding protein
MKKLLAAILGLAVTASAYAEPLKIAYSDWPGWVAWEIGIQKKWFEEEGVDVKFMWFDYVASMDAYVAGQVDAVSMTNGDALVTGATGKPSVGIIINDYSNGNDMVVGGPEVSLKGLKGKKIGVEVGFVSHLLLNEGLKSVGLTEDDVELVNTPTNETPQVLKSGAVSAIVAWQPSSGQALKAVSGSKPLFTSADAPGLIYDVLYVSPESLEKHPEEWAKVVKVWYKIVDFLKDDANFDEALKILAGRVSVDPSEYEAFYRGTHILSLDEALERWKEGDGFGSIYGSSVIVDKFNVDNEVYEKPLDVKKYLDPSLTKAYAESIHE